MQRQFNFKRRMIVDPSVAISHALFAVTFCALGFGVWGLVIGSYASYVTWAVTTWMLAGWRPRRGRFSYQLWREMARFGFPLVVWAIAQKSRDTFETVFVKRSLDFTALGNFRYGQRLSLLPSVAVIEVGAYVLFPAFARIAGDATRLRRAFLRALQWIWLGSAPVAAIFVVFGEPLMVTLFGEKWRAGGVALAAMAGFGLGDALRAVCVESIKGTGYSRRLHVVTVINLVAGVGLLVALVPFGLIGVGLAISGASLLMGGTALVLARPLVGASWGDIARRLIPPVVASIVAGAVLWPIEHLIVNADRFFAVGGFALLMVEVAGFFAVYFLALLIVAPQIAREVSAVVTNVVAKVRARRLPKPSGETD
jgi:PST family polysaccharide transporter